MMAPETPKKGGGAREALESPGPKKTDPTPQEAYFFLYILKHLKNKPEVDWDAVAQEANFKNGATANARFRQIKQKLGFAAAPTPKKTKDSGEASGSKPPRSRVRKTPRKSKAKGANGSGDGDDDGQANAAANYDEEDLHQAAELAKLASATTHFEDAMSRVKDEDDDDAHPMFPSGMLKADEEPELASRFEH